MSKQAVLGSVLALGVVLCASGEPTANAQTSSSLPMLALNNTATRARVSARISSGSPYQPIELAIGTANKWTVSISAVGPRPANAGLAPLLLCIVTVPSLADANTLVARITDPHTSGVGCAGTWTEASSNGYDEYRINLDLSAPLQANWGISFDVD
jgi:hypothetical protein